MLTIVLAKSPFHARKGPLTWARSEDSNPNPLTGRWPVRQIQTIGGLTAAEPVSRHGV